MKPKIEKSVRFASDAEYACNNNSDEDSVCSTTESGDIISWIPSEQLYEEDTFISESQKEGTSNEGDSKIQLDLSYETNTFIDIESEDETRTLSEYSYTDSFASSGVFSSHSPSDASTFREWRDVTEIVKGIEELEESDCVSKIEQLKLKAAQEETDITDSETEEVAEVLQQNFLNRTIKRLKLKDLQSLQDADHETCSSEHTDSRQGAGNHKLATFYQKMIKSCQGTKSSTTRSQSRDEESKPHTLEYYGLSSAIMERLKTESFQHWLKQKLADIEAETEKSLEYIQNNQHSVDMHQKQQFIEQMRSCVLKENIDDRIQAHFIKMHPVTWFSALINELPRMDAGSREILYRYKRQVESRVQDNKS